MTGAGECEVLVSRALELCPGWPGQVTDPYLDGGWSSFPKPQAPPPSPMAHSSQAPGQPEPPSCWCGDFGLATSLRLVTQGWWTVLRPRGPGREL